MWLSACKTVRVATSFNRRFCSMQIQTVTLLELNLIMWRSAEETLKTSTAVIKRPSVFSCFLYLSRLYAKKKHLSRFLLVLLALCKGGHSQRVTGSPPACRCHSVHCARNQVNQHETRLGLSSKMLNFVCTREIILLPVDVADMVLATMAQVFCSALGF